MRINTNIASMTAQENAQNVNKNLSSSLEKLSSGLRINKAADDSSGMSIADKLRTQASALGQSISNANSANALVQIADKAMAEQSNILDIVKTKLIQASTQTTSDEGREAIRKDVSKLLEQLDNIAEQTNYNGINLLNEKGAEFSFQVGEKSSYDISTTTAYAANTAGLGGGAGLTFTAGSDEVFTATAGVTLDEKNESISVRVGSTTAAATTINISGKNDTEGAKDATFELSANNVKKLTLATVTGTAAVAEVKITTTSEDMKSILDAATAEDSFSRNADGSYTLKATDASVDAVLDFGTAEVDLNQLKIEGFSMSSDGDAAEILKIDTRDSVNIKRTDENLGTASTSTEHKLDLIVTSSSGSTADDLAGGKLLDGLKDLKENGLTSDLANEYMAAIDEALNQINTVRSDFGSTQNQLDSFIRNAMTTQTNIKAAESVIRDVDYASESANFNKQNIIAQAGTYAMSQANAVQQNVMRLLQ